MSVMKAFLAISLLAYVAEGDEGIICSGDAGVSWLEPLHVAWEVTTLLYWHVVKSTTTAISDVHSVLCVGRRHRVKG
jgi:hypothetical protein